MSGPLAERLATGSVEIVAGTSHDERRAPRRPGPETGWHQPPHVREPSIVRERQAAQVAAGATVLVAQTYRTHRRALIPYGESRRVREWTEAAVRVAREAAEVGAERRATRDRGSGVAEPDGSPIQPHPAAVTGRAAPGAPAPGAPADRDASAVPAEPDAPALVAGIIPATITSDAVGEGRQPSADAAVERDLAEFAGTLVDAGVDLLLAEGAGSVAVGRAVAGAAAATGMDWLVAVDLLDPGTTRSGEPLGALLEALEPFGPVAVLAGVGSATAESSPNPAARGDADVVGQALVSVARHTDRPAGLWLAAPAAVGGSFEAGARILGIADGATPAAIAELRRAADERTRAVREERKQRDAAWLRWIAAAADRAPAGAALRVGAGTGRPSPPPGFAWSDASPSEVGRLPAERFRLAVIADPEIELAGIAASLEPGGILVARRDRTAAGIPDGLRVIDLDTDGDLTLVIARREAR